MVLVQVEFTNDLLRKPTKNEQDETIAELKVLLKVGKSVQVENGRHELLVKAKVCEITADGFFVEHGGRKTFSKFENAWYVKNKRTLILGDNEHSYAHVV